MRYFLIAGEASGDVIGAKLMRAIRAQDPRAEFSGIGGSAMAEEGMDILLPQTELAVMGLWEVAMQIPRLWKIMIGTLEEIEKREPDAVITIDFPDFNFILGKKLKKRGNFKGKLLHMVAPTVWAWRPGRAKKIAAFLDGLMCLYPFEPAYFKPHNLPAVYIGHPVTEEGAEPDEMAARGAAFRQQNNIPPDATVLGLLFGSREHEITVHGRALVETAIYMHERFPDLHVVMPTLPEMEYNLHAITGDIGAPKIVVTGQNAKKWDAFSAMNVAAAVSGTVGLELAYAGVPHVIGYKTSWVNWLLLRRLVKVNHIHLANIILDKDVVPEFLQISCTSEKIADATEKLLKEPVQSKAQKTAFSEMRDKLKTSAPPSQKAASFILKSIEKT